MNIEVLIKEEDEVGFRSSWATWPSLLVSLTKLKQSGLSLTRDELFAYSMYYEWHDRAGWRTHAELSSRLGSRRERFEDYLAEGEDLRLSMEAVKDVTESLGVGATLAASAKLLGLTEADFAKIPETSRHSTLDFGRTWMASDGEVIFNVEAKGTVDGASRAKQIRSIREKKADVRRPKGTTPLVELGMVLDLPLHANRAELILVDPPVDGVTIDPVKWKLLSRLRYYQEELRRVTTGRLSTSLADRIAVLDRLSTYADLDGLPLSGPFGAPVRIYDSIAHTLHTNEEVFHGRLYDLSLGAGRPRTPATRLLFRGLKREIILALGKQDFARITAFRYAPRPVAVDSWRNSGQSGGLLLSSAGIATGFISDPNWNVETEPSDEREDRDDLF
jgi:hypothetical protein